jgi:cold shock CspA family protein
MAKSQETFNKKEKEKKRLKKRKDKIQKQEDRKSAPNAGLDSMIAYVDEYGQLTDTPPDPAMKLKVNLDAIEISIPKKEDVFVDPIRKGKVDFYNSSKGFGFIKESETQEKYFVHVHNLLDDIEEGDMVTFELEKGLKGLNAVRVKKVN